MLAEPARPHHAAGLAEALADPAIDIWINEASPTEEYFTRQFEFLSQLAGSRSPDGTETWLTWVLLANDRPQLPIGYVQATIKEPERVKIAYVIARSAWRKGYAREAITAMLDFVFDRYNVAAAIAEIDTCNSVSMAFAAALGLNLIGRSRSFGKMRDVPYDDYIFQISRSDWLARTSKPRR